MQELGEAIDALDMDEQIHCIVIAGNDEVFAAGADIKAMAERSFQEVLNASTMPFWQRIASCKTPLVAAVSGFALGGGFELALLCDIIVASDTAEFGQPEITLGIIPGGGGTQRLAHVIGKQRTMELVLTGRRIDAKEALRLGIVNMLAPKKRWREEAIELARVIARRPALATRLAKQAVLAADEMSLSAGLLHERRLYELAMATEDRVEGMQAFIEKRRPDFKGR
jgi:enoyl-CoA hydratase/carnithine racemase